MADTKVTGLTENTTPAATDVIYIVDDPGGTPASQKVTLANIKALVNDITTDAEWDAKGDLVAGTGANTADRLAVGANNTVLMADSTTGTGLKWSASPIVVDTAWDAKGDLVAGTAANTAGVLTVGANGTVLTAASGETTGLSWATPTTVATDAVWDAAGDLVQGTGANTAGRLAIGTANQTLRVNAGATAVAWVSAGRVILSDTTTAASQKAVTLNPVPAGYNSIEFEVLGRSDRASNTTDNVQCVLNNDTTTTNYRLTTDGAVAAGTAAMTGADAVGVIGAVPAASSPANSAGSIWGKINSYTNTTWNKQVIALYGYRLDAATNHEAAGNAAYEWESTSAITRLDIQPSAGNWVDGSIVRIYGVY